MEPYMYAVCHDGRANIAASRARRRLFTPFHCGSLAKFSFSNSECNYEAHTRVVALQKLAGSVWIHIAGRRAPAWHATHVVERKRG
eukprot:COSAG05_NODE_1556_length_4568_cov_2.886776_4_plen_86_part_00